MIQQMHIVEERWDRDGNPVCLNDFQVMRKGQDGLLHIVAEKNLYYSEAWRVAKEAKVSNIRHVINEQELAILKSGGIDVPGSLAFNDAYWNLGVDGTYKGRIRWEGKAYYIDDPDALNIIGGFATDREGPAGPIPARDENWALLKTGPIPQDYRKNGGKQKVIGPVRHELEIEWDSRKGKQKTKIVHQVPRQ